MPKTISTYACAAKSLFSANTNAKGTKSDANLVKLGAILGHGGAILEHLGEYWGDLATIFAGLGGY